MKRHPNVVNVDELEVMSRGKGRFGANARRLANSAGAKAIGMNWMELAPGKTSFPYHWHTGVEEGIFILSGTGELRLGGERIAVRAGDYAAFLPGPDHAHTLTNNGTEPLRYLSFSNQNITDVCGYPDSKKLPSPGWRTPANGPTECGSAGSSKTRSRSTTTKARTRESRAREPGPAPDSAPSLPRARGGRYSQPASLPHSSPIVVSCELPARPFPGCDRAAIAPARVPLLPGDTSLARKA